MFAPDDTIVAIATPAGRGGVGVVRISGPRAEQTARLVLAGEPELKPRHVTLATAVDPTVPGRHLDRVLATYFPAPRSYTGEHVVELSGHGSPVLLRLIVSAAQAAGARVAEPGEFTLRAFLNGRLDLVQAEAVQDLVNAVTPLQARVAFDQLEGTVTAELSDLERKIFGLVTRLEASVDFPDEGYHFIEPAAVVDGLKELQQETRALLADAERGRLIREGGHVVVLGRPNVGKSTLFNRLLGAPRAIVASAAGTTRDLLTETVDLGGVPITLVDTAGIRSTDDDVESEGVTRALGALDSARGVILVLDQSRPLGPEDRVLLTDTEGKPRTIVVNKTDLLPAWTRDDLDREVARSRARGEAAENQPVAYLSLLNGSADSLTALREVLGESLFLRESLRDVPMITNLRHIRLLEQAVDALRRAEDVASREMAEELLLADLLDVQRLLGEVTGGRTADDVLNQIFSEFCIGK